MLRVYMIPPGSRKMNLNFYPNMGDSVTLFLSLLYFTARTPLLCFSSRCDYFDPSNFLFLFMISVLLFIYSFSLLSSSPSFFLSFRSDSFACSRNGPQRKAIFSHAVFCFVFGLPILKTSLPTPPTPLYALTSSGNSCERAFAFSAPRPSWK